MKYYSKNKTAFHVFLLSKGTTQIVVTRTISTVSELPTSHSSPPKLVLDDPTLIVSSSSFRNDMTPITCGPTWAQSSTTEEEQK